MIHFLVLFIPFPFLALSVPCRIYLLACNCAGMYVGVLLLFSGVIELVLIGPTEALLHAAVCPQSFHRGQQLLGEWLGVFHSRYHIDDHLRIRLQVINNSIKLNTSIIQMHGIYDSYHHSAINIQNCAWTCLLYTSDAADE